MRVIVLVTYVSAVVFVVAVLARFVKYQTMPIHLRWELYPVAHEKGRAHYGGSYLEELDWWTKPRKASLLGELKVMIPEIVLLAGVREHNRSHWLRSFPFHFGLYLLAGLIGLLAIGAVATLTGAAITADAGVLGRAVFHATYVIGWSGLGLGFLGSLALLGRRAFNVDYREYTKQSDYLNLVFFVITFGVAIGAHTFGDSQFVQLRAYVESLLSVDLSYRGTPLGVAEIVLASLLVAYIPLTHMSHFFTKWFMYHDIRWSDEPSRRGGNIEKKVDRALKYSVSWAAPHIRGDGKKNWVDVATSGVEEESKQ